mmetsp:Transcript_45273/g.105916  ORF Transcript_45273/g.105916 Transcript_45273/m.105916 type:complete len:247 (-) Transcript_45273:92-832(-)
MLARRSTFPVPVPTIHLRPGRRRRRHHRGHRRRASSPSPLPSLPPVPPSTPSLPPAPPQPPPPTITSSPTCSATVLLKVEWPNGTVLPHSATKYTMADVQGALQVPDSCQATTAWMSFESSAGIVEVIPGCTNSAQPAYNSSATYDFPELCGYPRPPPSPPMPSMTPSPPPAADVSDLVYKLGDGFDKIDRAKANLSFTSLSEENAAAKVVTNARSSFSKGRLSGIPSGVCVGVCVLRSALLQFYI